MAEKQDVRASWLRSRCRFLTSCVPLGIKSPQRLLWSMLTLSTLSYLSETTEMRWKKFKKRTMTWRENPRQTYRYWHTHTSEWTTQLYSAHLEPIHKLCMCMCVCVCVCACENGYKTGRTECVADEMFIYTSHKTRTHINVLSAFSFMYSTL